MPRELYTRILQCMLDGVPEGYDATYAAKGCDLSERYGAI